MPPELHRSARPAPSLAPSVVGHRPGRARGHVAPERRPQQRPDGVRQGHHGRRLGAGDRHLGGLRQGTRQAGRPAPVCQGRQLLVGASCSRPAAGTSPSRPSRHRPAGQHHARRTPSTWSTTASRSRSPRPPRAGPGSQIFVDGRSVSGSGKIMSNGDTQVVVAKQTVVINTGFEKATLVGMQGAPPKALGSARRIGASGAWRRARHPRGSSERRRHGRGGRTRRPVTARGSPPSPRPRTWSGWPRWSAVG